MSKKKELYDLADKFGEQLFEQICAGVLPPEMWKPVVMKDGKDPLPYMVLSKQVGGMVMVAKWVNVNQIQSVTEDDMADMIVGSDGRSTN